MNRPRRCVFLFRARDRTNASSPPDTVLQVLSAHFDYIGERVSTKDSTRHLYSFYEGDTFVEVGVMPLRDFEWIEAGLKRCVATMTEAERIDHVWKKIHLKKASRKTEYATFKLLPYETYIPQFIWRPIL